MKRVISAFLFVLVLVPLMMLMRWGGEAKATWSAPLDGVQARLVASRFLWRANEDVPVVVRLRNRGSEPRDVGAARVRLRILHEGRVVAEEELALGPAILPADGEADVPLRAGPLAIAGTGLYALDGSIESLGLLPLELRVLASKD